MSETALAPLANPEPLDSHTDPLPARGRRLTQTELGLILSLSAEGFTQVQIAQRLSVDQSAISLALKRLGVDTTELARHRAKASSYTAVKRLDRVVRNGKDAVAIKAADKILEVAGLTNDSKSNAVNNIVVQLGVSISAPAGPSDKV